MEVAANKSVCRFAKPSSLLGFATWKGLIKINQLLTF